MCELCNGISVDALMTQTFERIAANRFTMVGVEGPRRWAYTVGLVESFDHPELIVTGLEFERTSALLTGVADRVRAGERFTNAAGPIDVADTRVHFTPVHPAQWVQGRFNMWSAYYDWVGLRLDPTAIQVVWPLGSGCPPDRQCNCQPMLDHDPGHGVHGRNRAERRRAGRRR